MSVFRNIKRFRNRIRNHLLIIFACFSFGVLFYNYLYLFYNERGSVFFQISLTTAYISLLLLALTLTIGAVNVLREKQNPISIDLRRDIGIWCGVFSFIHVIAGFNVHLKSWLDYFIDNHGNLRADFFGFANYIGIAGIGVLLMLLATSNDISIRKLGRKSWKRVQYGNYLFALLIILHGIFYQVIEKRPLLFVFIFGTIIFLILTVQLIGFEKRKRMLRDNKKLQAN